MYNGREYDYLKNYLSRINWDWWFLKGQLILGSVLLSALFIYLLLAN
ncbi:hypothetical protein BH23BAC2_BH23BAC2_06680 [soil metagenome]